MKRLLTLISLFGVTSILQAGTISVSATGEAFLPADFVTVTVGVHSKCYKKSADAAKDNAAMANDLLAVLKKYEDPKLAQREKDLITAVGGYFVRQTETVYQGNQNVVLCANGWRTMKELTLKLGLIDKLAEVQDEVLAIVDRAPELASSGDPQTWAVLANPSPALTSDSRKALAATALKNAIQIAKAEVAAVTGECGLRGVKLTGIKLPEREAVPAHFAAEKAAPAPADSPFAFGAMKATVTRIFTFEYEASGTCR